MSASEQGFIEQALIYLSAAVIAVPLMNRLGMGSILGYLVAGVAIGPSALGLIQSTEAVLHISELGVVLLLFLIGLELEPRRLWNMRKPIFGMGGAQVALTVLVLTGAGFLVTRQFNLSLIAGMGFALSSTALVVQILRERNLLQLPLGQASFSVLLFQDLAVIAMLAIVPLLSGQVHPAAPAAPGTWPGPIRALLALGAVILLGRFLVRPLFRLVSRAGAREIFTGTSLLLILGTAFVMREVGLSMALGTFLAGVMLADSEFRHEIEVDIEPFKGLLLGLFFIAVGMSIDLGLVFRSPLEVAAVVISVMALKFAALFVLARRFGYSGSESALFGVGLVQGGEFAFVLFGQARTLGLLASSHSAILSISVALSMALTPLLFTFVERVVIPRLSRRGAARAEYHVEDEGSAVILAGYGRIGQVIGRLLHAQGIGLTILERDPSQIEVVARFGWKTFYGDVSRLDLLRAAGAERAKLLILAIDDMDAATRTIALAREHFPQLKVLVRAESRLEAYQFINAGVPTVRATFAPGLEMGVGALRLLGFPSHEAHMIGQRFRNYDRDQLFKTAHLMGDTSALISLSKESKEELTRIMRNDERRRGDIVEDGWG